MQTRQNKMKTKHEIILNKIRKRRESHSVEETIQKLHYSRTENGTTIEDYFKMVNINHQRKY